jgi:hypothetical protein
LAVGTNGLQVHSETNLIPSSSVCSSTCSSSGGTSTGFNAGWYAYRQTGATPFPTVTFNGSSNLAPDGSPTVQAVFPSAVNASDSSYLAIGLSTLTVGSVYTCGVSLQAVSANSRISMVVQDQNSPYSYAAGLIVEPTATPTIYQFQFYAIQATMQILIGTNQNAHTIWSPSGNIDNIAGGTANVGQVSCNLGLNLIGDVQTAGTAQTTAVNDNIAATGNLLTALHAAAGTAVITTQNGSIGGFGTGSVASGALIGNAGAVFFGRNTTDNLITTSSLATSSATDWRTAATSTISWGASSGAISLNGVLANDANARSLSGSVYIGSANGSANFWNGNITSIKVYSAQKTLVASDPPISGLILGGLPSWSGISANSLASYNTAYTPTGNGDSMAGSQGNSGIYYFTGGDTYGLFLNQNTSLGSMPSPGYPIASGNGLNASSVTNFVGLLGAGTEPGPCPLSGINNWWNPGTSAYVSTGSICETKPSGFLIVDGPTVGQASGNDVAIMGLSRQFESPISGYSNLIYGQFYTTIAYNATGESGWSNLANWNGLPPSRDADFPNPTFPYNNSSYGTGGNSIWPFGIAIPISNGNKAYLPLSTDYVNMNEYIYVELTGPSGMVTARIAIADLKTSIAYLNSAAGGNPDHWQFYGNDGAWHGGGTGGNGSVSDWTNVGTLSKNTAPANINYAWDVTYVPVHKTFVMLGWGNCLNCTTANTHSTLFAFEAKTPWGPWTQIPNSQISLEGGSLNFPNIVKSSLSVDGGLTAQMVIIGEPSAILYQMNMMKIGIRY